MPLPNPSLLFAKIEEFSNIVIVGHVNPDSDAYGSAMGFKLAIESFYPDKKVYAILDECFGVPSRLPKTTKPQELPDSFFKKALAIIVDTPTIDRLGDKRAINAKFVVKIDHHPLAEHFGDVELVDEHKCANSLIIADYLFAQFPILPADACECLLLGILSDSGNLRLTSDADAFNKVGRLIANGANIKEIYGAISDSSMTDLQLQQKILAALKIQEHLAFCIFSKDWLKKAKAPADTVASAINLIGFTKECPIWAFFVQYPTGTYRVLLRCSSEYDVSQVAVALGGGGHRQAAGANIKTAKEISKALDMLLALKPHQGV